jgi:hypothetical protein
MKSGGRQTIYFNGKVKACSGPCKLRKPLSEFDESGNAQGPDQAGFYKSRCRECHAAAVNQKAKEKRYTANPENYHICKCGSIVSKKRARCYSCKAVVPFICITC